MVIKLLAMVTAVLLPEISITRSLSGSGLRSRPCRCLCPTSMMLMFAPLKFLISLILAPRLPMTAPMMSLGTLISYLLIVTVRPGHVSPRCTHLVSLSLLSSLLRPAPPLCRLAKSAMASNELRPKSLIMGLRSLLISLLVCTQVSLVKLHVASHLSRSDIRDPPPPLAPPPSLKPVSGR